MDFAEMKQILEQYFLLLNGKEAMKGNLDLAGHKLLTTNLMLKEEDSDTFAIRDRADTAYKNLKSERNLFRYLEGWATYCYLRPKPLLGGQFQFQSHNGSEYLTCGTLVGGEMRITRAGDITGMFDATLSFPDVEAYTMKSNVIFERSAGYGVAIPNASDIIGIAGKTLDFPLFKVGGVSGVDGSFTTVDGKTVTVTKGLITSIV